VQSAAVPADKEFNNSDFASQWAHIEQTNKAAIQERKIRVAFLPADASTPAPKANGINHAADTPSAISHASPQAVTPSAHTTALENKPLSDTARSEPAADSPSSTFASAIPMNSEEVKAQLAEAKAQIVKLTKAASEQSELRRRKGAEVLEQKGFPNAAQALANPQSAGVPLQWVAILTFLAFLVGWLAF